MVINFYVSKQSLQFLFDSLFLLNYFSTCSLENQFFLIMLREIFHSLEKQQVRIKKEKTFKIFLMKMFKFYNLNLVNFPPNDESIHAFFQILQFLHKNLSQPEFKNFPLFLQKRTLKNIFKQSS